MRYNLENDHLLIEVSELGATLTKLIDKQSGIDIVFGYDTDEEYLKYFDSYMGSSVGRNCNRIGKGKFILDDKEYQLSINNHMNHLHGGADCFSFKMWKLFSISDDEIVLTYLSNDNEEGYPGNLSVKVSYKLEDNCLIYTYSGISDKDTLFNMTNHSYFNLGDKDIMNHELYITTDKYSPVDEYFLTLDEVLPVKNTPYDFTDYTLMKNAINQLEMGIDNNYVWEKTDDKLMASLRYNNLELNIYSDLPDMHLYTSYFLKTDSGKYERKYDKFMAMCLECQYYPNGINYGNKYLVPILKKDQERSDYIRYEVKHI